MSKQLLRRQQIASVTIRQQFAGVQSGNGSDQLIVGDSQGGHKEPHIDLLWNSGEAFECRVDVEKLCKNSLPAGDSAQVVIR